MTAPDPVGGAGMSSTAHPGTYGLWHAIYAIVATHARHNRGAMLIAIEQVRDRHERPKEEGDGLVQGR